MYYKDIPVESCVCTYRTMLYVPYVHTHTVHIVHTQGYDMLHCDNADLATGSVRCHTSRVPLESARCSTVIRRIIHDLCVYKQFHSIRSCKFNILSLDKYLKTFVFLLSTFYTLVLCSFKVGPGCQCHCDNADLATGSVRCHTSRVPLESARCSTVIRRIIHDLCVYKQFHSIRSCTFYILSLDKYL